MIDKIKREGGKERKRKEFNVMTRNGGQDREHREIR